MSSATRAKRVWAGVFGILAVLALTVGLIFAFGGASWITAPFRGEVEKRNLTEGSGTYRIAAYEEFYDTCATIQSLEDDLALMEEDKSLPENQRSANIFALTSARNKLIREYNADAQKEDTQAHFRASDLPHQIDPDNKETECDAS